jgi:hypothetical protein
MRNPKLRETANRTLNHLAMGMTLGVLLALGLLFGNGSTFYALAVGAYGEVGGPLNLAVGCALLTGVGAAITGFIFDEVERS